MSPRLPSAAAARANYWPMHVVRDANASSPARHAFIPRSRPKRRALAMILAGHYASERFAVEFLAELLAHEFPAAYVWAAPMNATRSFGASGTAVEPQFVALVEVRDKHCLVDVSARSISAGPKFCDLLEKIAGHD